MPAPMPALTPPNTNAVTHGLFTQDVVLPSHGEDPAAYDALLQQLCAQLPPRNHLEHHYLAQIAAASWRLRRLHRWQAQVYEDPTLTEDQKLDKLDKTLRHETALTRQIDRAVRLMHRDLPALFHDRARDAALRDYDATEQDCKDEPDLAILVQRKIWRQTQDAHADPQNCQNEPLTNPLPPPPTPPIIGGPGGPLLSTPGGPLLSTPGGPLPPSPVNLVHPTYQAPLPRTGGPGGRRGGEREPKRPGERPTQTRKKSYLKDPDDECPEVDEYGLAPGEYERLTKKCQNENRQNENRQNKKCQNEPTPATTPRDTPSDAPSPSDQPIGDTPPW